VVVAAAGETELDLQHLTQAQQLLRFMQSRPEISHVALWAEPDSELMKVPQHGCMAAQRRHLSVQQRHTGSTEENSTEIDINELGASGDFDIVDQRQNF
jgi:hypothetical protein